MESCARACTQDILGSRASTVILHCADVKLFSVCLEAEGGVADTMCPYRFPPFSGGTNPLPLPPWTASNRRGERSRSFLLF